MYAQRNSPTSATAEAAIIPLIREGMGGARVEEVTQDYDESA